MRQKDLDQLVDIAKKEIDFADPVELSGMEMLLGAVRKTVAYSNAGTLTFEGLDEQIKRCRTRSMWPTKGESQ